MVSSCAWSKGISKQVVRSPRHIADAKRKRPRIKYAVAFCVSHAGAYVAAIDKYDTLVAGGNGHGKHKLSEHRRCIQKLYAESLRENLESIQKVALSQNIGSKAGQALCDLPYRCLGVRLPLSRM